MKNALLDIGAGLFFGLFFILVPFLAIVGLISILEKYLPFRG